MNRIGSLPRANPASNPEFVSDGGSFFWLALRGGLLQIVTLGFYRFWLLTDIRRRLWSATRIGGDALEYTGRGKDLLIGFLIAMAILAPVFLVYFLIGLEAESYQAFASVPLYGFLFMFAQYAGYRARRYRLSRTVWRGVRFWMEKGAWRYAALSTGLGLLSMLTLGLYAPWRTAALERYKFERTRYGHIPASFTGTGGELFKAGVFYWVVSALAVLVAIGGGAVATMNGGPAGGAALGVATFLAMLVIGVCFALYLATEWRWFLSSVRIGEARAISAFPRGRILGLYLLYALSAIAILLAFGAVFAAAAFVYSRSGGELTFDPNNPVLPNLAPIVVGALGYLTVLTVIGATFRYFLQHNLWRAAIETLSVEGLETLSQARQAGTASNALGEGMLEGLDMGGF